MSIAVAAQAAAGSIRDPICTDRPGHNSATCTVPKGHAQIETGLADWSLTKAGGVRESDWVIGASAIKYGVTDTLHVELGITPYTRTRERTDGLHSTVSGFGDVVLRVKKELGGSGGFSAALYPYVKLPTASKRIGNGKVEAGLVVPLSYSIANTPLSLATSPEVDMVADANGHGYHTGMTQVAGLGLSASDRLSVGAELWGSWDWDPAATTRQVGVSGNAAYRLNDNLQIDGQIDFGLNRNTPNVEIGGGISSRF